MALVHIPVFTEFVPRYGTGISAGSITIFIVLMAVYILGISAYFHDSAACLLRDDHIIAAAQEERFTRKKNDEGFPVNSIKYCLHEGKIGLSEIDYIVFYEKPFLKFERLLETYLSFAPSGFFSFIKAIPLWLKQKLFLKRDMIRQLESIDEGGGDVKSKMLFTTHHQSHAASAFYPSPFINAVVLTVDGVGEWTTTSVGIGTGNSIKQTKEINFPHSLGLLYAAFTHYLGFRVNSDEYKVMGLAPYGKPVYLELIFEHLVDLKGDGSFRLDMRYFNYAAGLTMTGFRFNQLFGCVRRQPSDEITQFHMNIAASVQAAAEKIMLTLTSALYEEYQMDDLCMAGGVALNCVINGKILRQSGFKRLWIQPAAGDAGGALGAAYAVYYEYLKNTRNVSDDKMQNALLGPSFTDVQIKEAILAKGYSYTELEDAELFKTISAYLAKGMVIGWFNGRMEFGPRALGSRSILANPRIADMQSVLNNKIKFRESFRPFAPAILEEHAHTYFGLAGTSPYMLLVSEIQPFLRIATATVTAEQDGFKKLSVIRSLIPAVTHVNFTARVQTVSQHTNERFYRLISAFYELTNCPCLVNTSFNRMEEPIVNTPAEALACFEGTGIDVLVLEKFVVKKLNS